MIHDAMERIAADLLRREQALLDPVVRRDRARVSALLSDDFEEFGASGRVWTRNETLELLATERFVPPVIEDLACRRIADGVVLVTYRTVRTEVESGDRSIALRSSLWSNESGTWRLRFHQGTNLFSR